MKTEDIMTKNVITVDPSDKIEDVANILSENRIHGVPVVENNKIIGIITETDFFTKDAGNLYLPSFIDFVKKSKLTKKMSKGEKKRVEKIVKATARDIMTSGCITVSRELEIDELLQIFKDTKTHTLPVENESGEICGIITLADIVALIGLQLYN